MNRIVEGMKERKEIEEEKKGLGEEGRKGMVEVEDNIKKGGVEW